MSETHAPIRSRRVRSEYAPWINETIIQEMNHRDYLKKKAVASKSESTHKIYKVQRNRVNRLIRNSKRKFCINSIDLNKGNPNEMWKNIDATNNWLINMDRPLINWVIFLDLKKAFDTVDHEILIKKLELYGIRGNCQRWFVSYLSNRTQVCKVGKIYSSKMYVKTGVPQGYNLGPLLFLLFLNDLSNCLSTLQIISMSQYLVPLWRILKLSWIMSWKNYITAWLLANKLSLSACLLDLCIKRRFWI